MAADELSILAQMTDWDRDRKLSHAYSIREVGTASVTRKQKANRKWSAQDHLHHVIEDHDFLDLAQLNSPK